VIAALDGFADGVRWKPVSTSDSYFGYFVNDSTPGDLYTAYLVPGESAAEAHGSTDHTSWVQCAADADASDLLEIDLHISGSHAAGTEISYNNIVGEFGPKIPIAVAIEPGGLSVGAARQKRSYRRVAWREYQSEEDAMYRRCHPTD